MNMSGPIAKSLVNVAAIVSLAVPVFSQAAPKYDPATETTFKGVVGELKMIPPTGGKPIAYLVLKDSTDAAIFLCPRNSWTMLESSLRSTTPLKSRDRKSSRTGRT